MNSGAPPGSASRPPVVSPLFAIGAAETPPADLISSRTRHRAPAAAGAPRPTADCGFGRRPQPTASRRPTSTRRPPTPPAGAQPRLPPTTTPPAAAPTPPVSPAPTPPRPPPPSTSSPTFPSTPTLQLPDPVVDHNDDPHLLARVERYTYRDWAREQRAEPVCYAAIRFLSLDSPSPPPADLLDFIPSAQRPLLADVLALAAMKTLHRTDDETALLVQPPPTSQPGNSLPPPAPNFPPRLRSNADAPLGAEHMPRRHLPTPWSYPDGSHAGTVLLVDRHGHHLPLVDPPLPSLPGAQDLSTYHSLADPLPPFTQRPWYHRQR